MVAATAVCALGAAASASAATDVQQAQSGNWSGYVSGIHLVTTENIGSDGGPDNVFDPANGYRDVYKKIWGVK